MAVVAPTVDQSLQPVGPEQTDFYRLMVLDRTGKDVLLQHEATNYRLPEVQIPRFTRPAEQITSLLRNNWKMATVFLFSSRIESDPERPYYAVLEACGGSWEVPSEFAWCPVQSACTYLLNDGEPDLLRSSHAKAIQAHFGVDRAPFSRLGWVHRLHDWAELTIRPLGIELTDLAQLNGGETFCLVRLGTTRKPLWFKAVGQPNLDEFPITLLLSKLFPDYVPAVVASDPSLNGWLMESGGHLTLRECENPEIWRSAVQRLASLQIESIGRTSQLLQAGCRDLRIETLTSYVAPFFSVMAKLMEQQTKHPPAPLTKEELSELARTVVVGLRLLAEVGMPNTLGHSDFNPGNILVDGDRCLFIDWAEAHVGHPFLTFEYFAAHLRNSCPVLIRQEDCWRKAYSDVWRSAAASTEVTRALDLSPLIAAYAYASSGKAWRDVECLALPGVPAYLRSVTRRMKVEACTFNQRSDSCRQC